MNNIPRIWTKKVRDKLNINSIKSKDLQKRKIVTVELHSKPPSPYSDQFVDFIVMLLCHCTYFIIELSEFRRVQICENENFHDQWSNRLKTEETHENFLIPDNFETFQFLNQFKDSF